MIKILFQVFAVCFILHQISCDQCDTFPDLKNGLHYSACCQTPFLFNDSWLEYCKTEMPMPQKIGVKYLEYECKFYECVFKIGGGVVNGKPSAAEIKKQMKTVLDQYPGWEKGFNAAVDKCVPEVITKEDETRKRASEPQYNIDKNVNTMYGHLVTCIGANLFLDCPVPIDGDHPRCATFKNFIKTCVNEYPPRFMNFQAK